MIEAYIVRHKYLKLRNKGSTLASARHWKYYASLVKKYKGAFYDNLNEPHRHSQYVSWTYIRRSEDIQKTSYVR